MDTLRAGFVFFSFFVTTVYSGCRHFNRHVHYYPANTTCSCRFPEGKLDEKHMIPGHLCNRPCHGRPKACHFTFYVEEYSTMAMACGNCPQVLTDCWNPGCIVADGYPRIMAAINRKMPGPSIEVCQNDILVIDVINIMHAATTSIHWHGIRQNDGAQYFDGTPFISQCPIMPGNKFRYTFKVPDCGTYWYHSHSGMQRPDGMVGSLIVKCIKEPLEHMYDYDHTTIVFNDWSSKTANDLIIPTGFKLEDKDYHPDTVLINGRANSNNTNPEKTVPVTIIKVEEGKRYRCRLVAATSYPCQYLFQIQQHPLTLITIDGGLRVKPVRCDTVTLNAAERYDVVFTTNQAADKIFYILVQGVGTCSNVRSYALLQYGQSDATLNFTEIEINSRSLFPIQKNITCNAVDSTCNKTRSDDDKANNICIIDLESEDTPPIDTTDKTQCSNNITYIFDFELVTVTREDLEKRKYEQYIMPGADYILLAVANSIIFSNPSTTLLGTAMYNPPDTFCNTTCLDRSIVKEFPCECTAVYPIDLNSHVTIIARFKDTELSHPLHLHGYNFEVLLQEGGPQYVNMSDDELKALVFSNLTKSTNRPVKDVVSVPPQGVVIIQFIADNPGYWLLHCHYSFHGELGMTVALKVGTNEEHPPMPIGFPKCLDFVTNCL